MCALRSGCLRKALHRGFCLRRPQHFLPAGGRQHGLGLRQARDHERQVCPSTDRYWTPPNCPTERFCDAVWWGRRWGDMRGWGITGLRLLVKENPYQEGVKFPVWWSGRGGGAKSRSCEILALVSWLPVFRGSPFPNDFNSHNYKCRHNLNVRYGSQRQKDITPPLRTILPSRDNKLRVPYTGHTSC